MGEDRNPEVAVDRALAERLTARAAPELGPLLLEPLGAGWDDTAFLDRDADGARRVLPQRPIAAP